MGRNKTLLVSTTTHDERFSHVKSIWPAMPGLRYQTGSKGDEMSVLQQVRSIQNPGQTVLVFDELFCFTHAHDLVGQDWGFQLA